MSIPYRPITLALITLAFSLTFLQRAQAGGGHFFAPVADPVVKAECGSCHLAYPPSMLPARSWTQLMAELKNHFGDDASLDTETTQRITRYLNDNAADTGGQHFGRKLMRGVALQNPPLRITELPKWVSEHRKISPSEWKRKDVVSKTNCVACHVDAERGVFDE
jgi:hypothetical protein